MGGLKKVLTCGIALAVTTIPATAQNELSTQGMLAVAKIAGACGVLDTMIGFQKTTRMTGGDEFVARFWAVEATRLGLSVKELSNRCSQSIMAYEKLWTASQPEAKR